MRRDPLQPRVGGGPDHGQMEAALGHRRPHLVERGDGRGAGESADRQHLLTTGVGEQGSHDRGVRRQQDGRAAAVALEQRQVRARRGRPVHEGVADLGGRPGGQERRGERAVTALHERHGGGRRSDQQGDQHRPERRSRPHGLRS